jgi:hypothetical protein
MSVWQLFTGVQPPLRFKPPNCKRLQGAADASAQTYVLYFKCLADAVSCEHLRLVKLINVEVRRRINDR